MKKLLVLATCGWLAVAGLSAESFLQQLTPEERHAAGLDALTPGQQQALDGLAERYAKEGARVTEAKVRAETEAKVREETKVLVEAETKKQEAAKVGLTDTKAASEIVRSKIKGEFEGWSGRTLFVLENGQQWVQTDKYDLYVSPPGPGPEVEVRHSSTGWKLFLMPGGGRWVHVRRVN